MTKTHKAVFSVGVGKDRFGADITFSNALARRDSSLRHASNIFGGATVTENFGAWKDDDGVIIYEESWTWTIISDKKDKFREFAAFLRDLYNQSAVLLVVSEVESEFV